MYQNSGEKDDGIPYLFYNKNKKDEKVFYSNYSSIPISFFL